MHKLCFFFVCCLSLLFAFSYGKVRPHGARSIVLSSTNAGDIANYNFSMTLDTELPSTGVIEITFPFNQYIAGLGLPYAFQVYAPYPNQITATLDSDTAKTVICNVGYRAANESFTIEIRNVRNPSKIGGTGNFKVSSKVGSKILDTNNNFGLIGIFEESTTLLSAQIDFVSGQSEIAGEYTSYVMSFIPSVNLPANVDIKIIFPTVYDFSAVESTQCTETGGLGLTLKCVTNQQLKNVIIFQGFTNAISQGTTIQLQLTDVLNPSSEMTTEALSYWVREVGTNNTIQKAEGVPGLYINPGSISSVKITNSAPAFPLYTNIERDLILSFQPSNPFNVIKIGTSFPVISGCTVINGLSMKDEITPIVCSASSHVMVIKGQKTYTPQDIYLRTVQIKFTATMPSRNYLTNKVEIYTYLDEGFIQKVDQDTDSSASQVQVITLTTVTSVSSTLTTTSTVPLAANTLTLTINPNQTYTAAPYIVLELSRQFTGVPSCTYALLDSATFNAKTCTLKNGVLTIQLNDDVGFYTATSTSPVTVQIAGLYNPPLPKKYYIRYYVYSSTSVIAEYYLNSFTVATNPISTISMLPLADALDHVTIYVLKFTTPNFLEDGFFLTDEPNKLSSRIDILFNIMVTGTGTFTYDLGSTLPDRSDYPCEFVGLDPSVFATQPRCILIQGPSSGATATDVATIRVLDFNAVLAGTTLTINIPVKNSALGSNTPIATINTYTIKDYTPYLTSQSVQTLTATTGNLGTSAPATSISLTNTSVQAQSDLSFTFDTNNAINAGSNSSIQIEYPKGYTIDPRYITVTLGGTAVNPNKLHFASAFNFLTIELAANLGTGSHTIVITNITTPNASLATGNTLIVRTLETHAYVDVITFTMPNIVPGASVDGIAMAITPDTFQYPYAAYQFNFTTTAYSPAGASIKVIFPASYTFDSYAECTNIVGLSDQSTTNQVTCAFSGSTLTITKFAALIPDQDIQIDIFGITNPSASISGQSFIINILDKVSNKIESLTLSATGSTIVGPAFASRDLNVSVSRITPRNPLVDAAFLMTMDPGYNLPKGAVMTINFDSAFSVLFTETVDLIECVAQGGLYALHQCAASGVQLTIKFGETSNASIPIDINYFGLIRYPSASTTLTGFSATLTYKGITIADTTSSGFPTMTTSTPISPLSDIKMDYYPRNEGEMANYLFTFNLTTTELNDTMYFLVRFPHEYDPDLFKYSPVAESSDLTGYLNADVMSRQIKIYGFESMNVTGPITLRLWGIVNPNKVDISKTGTFTVALMYEDDALEGNFNIPGIVPLLAPDSIQFISLTSTSVYSRHSNDYSLNFLSRKDILPSSLGGYLFMDFPPDFLIDSYAGKCDINEDFSFFVSCTIDNNRVFVNSSNPSWTTLMGSLNLTLEDIRTPDNDGETLNFVVSNYDSVGKKVLSRSYGNLNPASLTYIYDGLLITVNDDEEVNVEVGTYTDEIVIKMPGPSLQAITLTPNTLDAKILVTPFPLKIDLGDTEARFRVAAPRSMLLKKFYITWSKTGDSLVTTYANLRRTTLRMRKGWVKRAIESENMEFIPVGGITFPLLVFTNNPPYTDLIVNLFVRNSDTQATISTSTLTLGGGVYNQNYTISVDELHPLTFVEIGFTLAGTDGASFELVADYIHIPIIAKEGFLPSILSASVVSTDRSTATFTVTTNTLSFIYYVIAYKNMPVPTFADVSGKVANQTLEYSKPIFGETYIKKTPKEVTFTVSALTPGRDYQIYAYVMNLNQIYNPIYQRLDFSTNTPHRIAEFILPIKQSSIATDVKKEIISRIALMLSVDKARLVEKFTDCEQSQDSLSYHAANTTYFHLNLLPDPTSENDNATPLKLVQNLNSRTDEIREFIPRLADGDLLQVQALSPEIPTFTVRPSLSKSDYEALTFSVTVGKCGYLHAVAIPIVDSQNDTATDATVYQSEAPVTDVYPSSFQIYSGYDDSNQPALYSKLRVSNFANDYSFTIQGLKDHLIYNVYITTENDWPAYTMLLNNTAVARVESKTIKRRKPLNVFSINKKEYVTDDDSSSPLLTSQISWIGLLMTLFFVWIA